MITQMIPITHQEAQELSRSVQGNFSYLLPSGEKLTARKYAGRWYVVPASDRFQVKDSSGKVIQVA